MLQCMLAAERHDVGESPANLWFGLGRHMFRARTCPHRQSPPLGGLCVLAGCLLFNLTLKKKAGGGKTAGCPNQNQGRVAKPVARVQSTRIYLASTDDSPGRQPPLRLPAPAIPHAAPTA